MQYFSSTIETIPPGLGFPLFGAVHLAWLALFFAAAVFCSLLYRRLSREKRRRMRLVFAVLLLADEAFKTVCLLAAGNYLFTYLPLHLCSINIILIVIHAPRPSRLLGSFLYTVCIPAAAAALLFPTWTSLPPANFMHLHSFTVHILLAVYPIMLTAGGDIRPRLREVPYCLGLLAVLAVLIYPVNLLLDTNFMFLMYAPEGNPLAWFESTLGNHLIGYPVLIAAVVAVMFLPVVLARHRRRSGAAPLV